MKVFLNEIRARFVRDCVCVNRFVRLTSFACFVCWLWCSFSLGFFSVSFLDSVCVCSLNVIEHNCISAINLSTYRHKSGSPHTHQFCFHQLVRSSSLSSTSFLCEKIQMIIKWIIFLLFGYLPFLSLSHLLLLRMPFERLEIMYPILWRRHLVMVKRSILLLIHSQRCFIINNH